MNNAQKAASALVAAGVGEWAKPSPASDGYARPRTRGELARLLKSGVKCEVVSTNAEITRSMLVGWMGFDWGDITVRPSENLGWSVFERA